MSELLILILLLGIPTAIRIMVGTVFLVKRANLSVAEKQWELVQRIMIEAIDFVEMEAKRLEQARDSPVAEEEKRELATTFALKLLHRFNLRERYEFLVEPLVVGKIVKR
jgi:hypothetical protein